MTFTIPRADWVSDDLAAERGEHAGFEMFSREANDAVAQMIIDVTTEAETKMLLRGAIIERLQQGVAEVRKTYPEVGDTEPEWRIVDVMNLWLDQNGFRNIGRDDLS